MSRCRSKKTLKLRVTGLCEGGLWFQFNTPLEFICIYMQIIMIHYSTAISNTFAMCLSCHYITATPSGLLFHNLAKIHVETEVQQRNTRITSTIICFKGNGPPAGKTCREIIDQPMLTHLNIGNWVHKFCCESGLSRICITLLLKLPFQLNYTTNKQQNCHTNAVSFNNFVFKSFSIYWTPSICREWLFDNDRYLGFLGSRVWGGETT